MIRLTLTYPGVLAVLGALAGLTGARGAADALMIARMRVAVQRLKDELEAERVALIQQFDERGLGYKEGEDVPLELRKAIADFRDEERELELRGPLKLTSLRGDNAPEVEDPDALSTLLYYGVIEDDLADEWD